MLDGINMALTSKNLNLLSIGIALLIVAFFSSNIGEPVVIIAIYNIAIAIVFIFLYRQRKINLLTDNKKRDDLQRQQIDSITNLDQQTSELAINAASVSYSVFTLSKHITNINKDVDSLSAAAIELDANNNELSQHAKRSAEMTVKARMNSEESSKQLVSQTNQIKKLSEEVKYSSEMIKLLEQQTNKIQTITEVIDGISSQTNLLALNAAIEAARAGEFGRGFAVVADEVRALASKTSEATGQIGNMLTEIAEVAISTSNKMSELEVNSTEVLTSMELLNNTLSDIELLMRESSDITASIDSALNEQSLATNEISKTILNVNTLLSDSASDLEQVSDNADTLSQETEEIFVQTYNMGSKSFQAKLAGIAIESALAVSRRFEIAITNGEITEKQLFSRQYRQIGDVSPLKYHTDFDHFTDNVLPSIQEPILEKDKHIIYAGAVDDHGYFPTHNKKFSQPLTGNYELDVIQNRTKRMFNDATGIRCGQNKHIFLLQTYKRDTGEVLHDVSAPIYVRGRHWGGFRVGFTSVNP